MKVRKGSINYWLLVALEKSVDGTVRLEDFTYNSYKYMGAAQLPELRKSSVSESIRRLRMQGIIEKSADSDGNAILLLTELGKDYFGEREAWDGKYKIVIWDIPEKNKRVRNLLRRKLKEWDFINLQKSVWVTKRNVTEKLRKLIDELELSDSIIVIETDDKSLEKYFTNNLSS